MFLSCKGAQTERKSGRSPHYSAAGPSERPPGPLSHQGLGWPSCHRPYACPSCRSAGAGAPCSAPSCPRPPCPGSCPASTWTSPGSRRPFAPRAAGRVAESHLPLAAIGGGPRGRAGPLSRPLEAHSSRRAYRQNALTHHTIVASHPFVVLTPGSGASQERYPDFVTPRRTKKALAKVTASRPRRSLDPGGSCGHERLWLITGLHRPWKGVTAPPRLGRRTGAAKSRS
jgi:hypothetical protein